MLPHGRARGRTCARFPRTTAAPAMGSRRRAAWLPVRRSCRTAAPHRTDFGGQHREQLRIRVTSRRATKVQAPEVIWHAPVETRVALVVLVDDHGHDEPATHN